MKCPECGTGAHTYIPFAVVCVNGQRVRDFRMCWDCRDKMRKNAPYGVTIR